MFTKLLHKAAEKLGYVPKSKVDEAVKEAVKDSGELLVDAHNALRNYETLVAGLNDAVGMLQGRREADYRDYTIALCSFLTMSGGSVTIPVDILDAVVATWEGVRVDYANNDDGSVTLSLVEPEPEAAEAGQQ